MQESSNWEVLIVDDEPHNISVVKYVLEFNDVMVKTCESGAECLSILETFLSVVCLAGYPNAGDGRV